jgi:ABC-type uncharacterized transport system permease subunit
MEKTISVHFTLITMPIFLPYLLTSALYAVLGFMFWRANWARRIVDAGRWLPRARVAVLLPLAWHAWLLVSGSWNAGMLNIGVGDAVSAIVWLTLAVYALSSLRQPVDALQALILPIAALAVLLPLWQSAQTMQIAMSPLFLLHIALSLLAYALFTIAALHAGMMALFEKRLHAHAVNRAPANLPPLLTLERLLFSIIGIGFVLLTLALASGILFSEQVFGKPFSFSHFTQHKTVFALLSWLTYAGLLAGRKRYGWRGRTAITWSLTGFAMLVLAYIGSKIVLQLLLGK